MTLRPGNQEVKGEDREVRCDGQWPSSEGGQEKPGKGTGPRVGLAQVDAAAYPRSVPQGRAPPARPQLSAVSRINSLLTQTLYHPPEMEIILS